MFAAIFIFLALGLATTGLAIYLSLRFRKTAEISPEQLKKNFWLTSGNSLLGGIFYTLMLVFLALNMKEEPPVLAYEWALIICGGIALFTGLNQGISSLITKYYVKSETTEKHKFTNRVLYYVSIAFVFIGLLLVLEGFSLHMQYPLVHGFRFGIPFWTRPHDGNSPLVTFYALFILAGVFLVYGIADRKMYLQYGEHGILDSTLFAGFVPGILGARLWWVIANGQIQNFFDFAGGGLAIQGGLVLGAICGAGWFMWRKPKYSILVVVDAVIPTILLAQAIGRWGNFFNQEVYGAALGSDVNNLGFWNILPTWIRENMFIDGQYRVPFFLVEGAANLLGYFFLGFLLPKTLKKWWETGDGGAGYLIWYGVVRIIMEPLRNPDFIMTTENGVQVSVIFSAIFIGVGVAALIFNHVFRYFYRKKKRQLMANLHYKALICDFDGTIANSDNLLLTAFQTLYNIHKPGEKITFEETQKFSGPPMKETLLKEFPDLDQEKLYQEYLNISNANSNQVELYPNVLKTIKALHRAGVRLAIFTNKSRNGVIQQLKSNKIERYFEIIVGAEDLTNPKPDPEGLNLILEKLNLPKEELLFVGDSEYDYLAAQAAGIDHVIVSWSPRLNEGWTPTFVIKDFEEMVGIMNGKQ